MLNSIHHQLRSLYRLEHSWDLNDFVVPLSQFPEPPLDRQEQVLVRESEGYCEMALVLDDALLDPDSPWNLDRFCLCAEGISHLPYLALTAERNAQVSQLELELQAEIDKFILLLFRGMQPRVLLDRLFRNFALHEDVQKAGEQQRYTEANRRALQYCSYLLNRFVREKRTTALLDEVRRVYRMAGVRKLAYVSECRL